VFSGSKADEITYNQGIALQKSDKALDHKQQKP
jgi:hypothetical protein